MQKGPSLPGGGREEAAASVVGAVSRALIEADAFRGTAGSCVSAGTGGGVWGGGPEPHSVCL